MAGHRDTAENSIEPVGNLTNKSNKSDNQSSDLSDKSSQSTNKSSQSTNKSSKSANRFSKSANRFSKRANKTNKSAKRFSKLINKPNKSDGTMNCLIRPVDQISCVPLINITNLFDANVTTHGCQTKRSMARAAAFTNCRPINTYTFNQPDIQCFCQANLNEIPTIKKKIKVNTEVPSDEEKIIQNVKQRELIKIIRQLQRATDVDSSIDEVSSINLISVKDTTNTGGDVAIGDTSKVANVAPIVKVAPVVKVAKVASAAQIAKVANATQAAKDDQITNDKGAVKDTSCVKMSYPARTRNSHPIRMIRPKISPNSYQRRLSSAAFHRQRLSRSPSPTEIKIDPPPTH